MKYHIVILPHQGIAINPGKVFMVGEKAAVELVKGGKKFLVFTSFYQRFMKDYSEVVFPLTMISKKGIKFQWTKEVNQAC